MTLRSLHVAVGWQGTLFHGRIAFPRMPQAQYLHPPVQVHFGGILVRVTRHICVLFLWSCWCGPDLPRVRTVLISALLLGSGPCSPFPSVLEISSSCALLSQTSAASHSMTASGVFAATAGRLASPGGSPQEPVPQGICRLISLQIFPLATKLGVTSAPH